MKVLNKPITGVVIKVLSEPPNPVQVVVLCHDDEIKHYEVGDFEVIEDPEAAENKLAARAYWAGWHGRACVYTEGPMEPHIHTAYVKGEDAHRRSKLQTSPTYMPRSPSYTPTSPAYSPTSPANSPTSQNH